MFTKLRSLPLLFPTIGWVFGLALARADTVPVSVCLALLLILSLLLLKWRKAILISGLLGMLYGLSTLVFDVQRVLVPEHWLHQKIQITATIQDIRTTKTYTRLRLKGVVNQQGEALDGLLDVYAYRNKQVLSPMMSVQMQVNLHLPRNKLNPDGFDYEQYIFDQHVAATGSVAGDVSLLSQEHSLLHDLRSNIAAALLGVDEEAQGVLLALLLADRSQIPLQIDDAFAASGASHLLAISGLHMGLVAAWGFMLCWWLLTRREAWIVNVPVRAASLTFGLVLAMAYATLAGWPIPAQRASLMLLAGVAAWWFRASHKPINTMLAALMLIVLFDPASVLSVSLWLSFVATSALLLWVMSQPPTQSLAEKFKLWFKAMFWVSLIASLATLPLIAFTFERLPVWSLLANMMLVPLYSIWILPLALLGELLALLGLTGFAVHVFDWSAYGITWANAILLAIQSLPAGNLWLRADLPWLHGVLALLLILTGYLLHLQRFKTSACLLGLTLLLYGSVMLSESEVLQPEFHVWDVGQGASALLRLPDFNLVVDAPGKQGSKFNGGSIAAENARALGVLHIDAVVLSHAQSDHAGGLHRLLASLNAVNTLWLADVPANRNYQAFQGLENKTNIRWLKQGDVIEVGQTQIKVLWPPLAYQASNGNNDSLVLLVTLATGQTLLFPGDIEQQVERQILDDLQAVDVLLMPHHGSKTSSTQAFVQKTKAKVVIAQTGYRNFYGFPKEEVLARYRAEGAQIWDTAAGAVSIYFDTGVMNSSSFQAESISKRETVKAWLNKHAME